MNPKSQTMLSMKPTKSALSFLKSSVSGVCLFRFWILTISWSWN